MNIRFVSPTLLVTLACSVIAGGCAEGRGPGGSSKVPVPASEPEAKSDSAASAWTTSDDGKLSLRIVTVHGHSATNIWLKRQGSRSPGQKGRLITREILQVIRFTLAEAAAGVRFDYDFGVAEGLEGGIPFPQDSGRAMGSGPSDLMPFETIKGDGQSYGLYDVGLGQPDLRLRKIEQGTYPYSFVWDGRNWGGPSDTSMPKGEPFPLGTYTFRVRVQGEIETPKGRKPYDVSDTAKIVLTP